MTVMMNGADLVEVPHAPGLEDEGVTAGPRVVTGPIRLLSLLSPSSYNNQREQENPGTNIIY